MYQADGDRPLMPEIAAQPQYSDGSHGGELRLKIRRIADLMRCIIDQQNVKRTRIQRANGLIQAADKFRGRGPVIAKRHENDETCSGDGAEVLEAVGELKRSPNHDVLEPKLSATSVLSLQTLILSPQPRITTNCGRHYAT